MLDSTRPLDLRESAVMGRPLEGPVKEPVYFRIQQCIEHLAGRSGDCSFKLKFNGLGSCPHYFCPFFFLSLKYCSNWSRRWVQNRSYSCSHPATSLRGSPRNEM